MTRLYARVLADLWAPLKKLKERASESPRSTASIWDGLTRAHYTTMLYRRIA